VLGFHGLLAEWIDLALLAAVARAFPNASLAIVGEVRVATTLLDGLANVHLLGRRPYDELPGYCRGFDVALLPFVLDELTLHASPLKLREYLAAGLPVVATALPEARLLARAHRGVRVADDATGFVAEIARALADPEPRAARSDAIAGESWDAKLDELSALLGSAR
jgi:glycosyltransferase involved in cell wall biosynthesis